MSITEHPAKIDDGCAFCRIIRGEDPWTKIICEDVRWVAFFPSKPATPGHTLVVPREHVPDVWSLDIALGADLMSAVVRVGRAIRRAVRPAGMNLISSSGKAAEQTVFHLHLHVVPRYEGDDIDPIWPQKSDLDEDLRQDIAERIRKACAST
jgi:diadenosine tetraphosphate (Ap4A) HIT family hydrolase